VNTIDSSARPVRLGPWSARGGGKRRAGRGERRLGRVIGAEKFRPSGRRAVGIGRGANLESDDRVRRHIGLPGENRRRVPGIQPQRPGDEFSFGDILGRILLDTERRAAQIEVSPVTEIRLVETDPQDRRGGSVGHSGFHAELVPRLVPLAEAERRRPDLAPVFAEPLDLRPIVVPVTGRLLQVEVVTGREQEPALRAGGDRDRPGSQLEGSVLLAGRARDPQAAAALRTGGTRHGDRQRLLIVGHLPGIQPAVESFQEDGFPATGEPNGAAAERFRLHAAPRAILRGRGVGIDRRTRRSPVRPTAQPQQNDDRK